MSPPVIKVLFLSANPTDHNIRIDVEVREIEEGIKRGKYRDNLQFVAKLAARPQDIQRALLDVKPDIVHFSSHGDPLGSLIVEAPEGKGGKKVKRTALADLFETIKQRNPVRCVLISACHSEEALDILHQHVPFVIGMTGAVHDEAARVFEIGFYDALVNGYSIPFAFKWGCNAMKLHRFDGGIPVLRAAEGDEGRLFPDDQETHISEIMTSAPTPGIPRRNDKGFSGDADAINMLNELDRHLGRLTRRDMQFVIDRMDGMVECLSRDFPNSELKNELVLFRRQLYDTQQQSRTNVIRTDQAQLELDSWVHRFQLFLPELKEYLEDASRRKELDEESEIRRKEERVFQAFSDLKFDRQQKVKFALFLRSKKGVLFHIHGQPGHGQKWLYNQILKIHEFLDKKPEVLHRIIDLSSRSSSDAYSDIELDFLNIFGLPPGTDSKEDLIAKIVAVLQERNILIAFKNPVPEVSIELTRFFVGLFQHIESSIRDHNLIIVFLTDRIENNVGVPHLSPINAYMFKEWIGDCTAANHAPIADLYQDLLDKADDTWCEKLREINPTTLFGVPVSDREPEPTVPAEQFIRHITEKKLGLNWEKCKAQWMPY